MSTPAPTTARARWGGEERSVCSIKDVLRRESIKKVTQQKLDEICYLINQHLQNTSGTPAERLLVIVPDPVF